MEESTPLFMKLHKPQLATCFLALLIAGTLVVVAPKQVLASCSPPSAYRCVIEAEPTLLYYWPMDESAGATSLAPAVGGTPINLTGATAGASGRVDGTAVSFNGTSDYGSTTSNINLTGYNKIVVEALVDFNTNSATAVAWELGNEASASQGFYFAANNGNGTFAPALYGNVGYNYAEYSHAADATWHQVVAVYNKGASTNEVDLYVDGALQTALTRPINSNNADNFVNDRLYLMSRAGSSLFTAGKIQHLAIYSDLSDSRILAHAQASVFQFTAGTLSESSNTSSTATLSWTSSTSGTGSITEQLQRSAHGAGSWSNVAGANASPATDSGLTSQTSYDYRVAYTDLSPTTIYSNTVTVTTRRLYPPYSANSDSVITAPYDTAVSGSANWGNFGANTSMDILTIGHKYRIRQSGTITSVRLYTVNKTGLTGFYITVYRLNGTTYSLVGKSENLASQLVAGSFATTTLASPITGVQEGDYYGMRIESLSGSATSNFVARTSQTGVSAAYILNAASATTSSTWASPVASIVSGSVMPIELYMQAPQTVFIGDSIIAGYNAHLSFLSTTETTNIASTIESQFSNLTGFTYQNMGIGGENTSQIAARFAADVISLHPRIAIIEGGVNDLAQGVSKSTFLANWTSMLTAAQASNSITAVLVLEILPWSNGTNVQMQTRDDWNASLTTLAAGYSKAIVVDASSYVGQFRSGGDGGNLWDIQSAYNADGVHFTSAGHGQIAQALADAVPAALTITTSVPTAVASSTLTMNANISATGGASIAQSGFAYGNISDLSAVIATSSLGSQGGTGNFTSGLSGLTPNTLYYFRAYATNLVGTSTGAILSTTTLPVTAPSITTQAVSSITATTATANGTITATGNIDATVRGVVYGQTSAYGATTTSSGDFGTGTFTSSISSLTCNTTYHVAGYATNSQGTSYGSDVSFTTSACADTSSATVPAAKGNGAPIGITVVNPVKSRPEIIYPDGRVVYLDERAITTMATTPPIPPQVPPAWPFIQNRQLWDRGEDIRSLQEFLNRNGFLVTISGIGSPGHETTTFGTLTMKALKKYQKSAGLPASGYLGPLTRDAINKTKR